MRSSDAPVGGIEASTEGQIRRLVAALRDVLNGDIVGVYLYGSAVQGGLRPRSDIDIMVVTTRRTNPSQKRRLSDHLLALSGEGGSSGPSRPVELVIAVQAEIRPWRYPPAFDFMYGEWLRHEFECGELQPWPSTTSPDLAVLVAMVLLGNTALLGPPPAQVFDPIPHGDLLRATVSGIDSLLDDLDSDTRNVVLTLARIWCSVGTGTIRSKDGAAGWVLGRLPQEHRVVLARARAIYLGEEEERWEDVRLQVRAYADYVVSEARRASTGLA